MCGSLCPPPPPPPPALSLSLSLSSFYSVSWKRKKQSHSHSLAKEFKALRHTPTEVRLYHAHTFNIVSHEPVQKACPVAFTPRQLTRFSWLIRPCTGLSPLPSVSHT